jgi:two-component system, cell cycle sensor histidine kinase and response regulator CckA
MARSKKAAPKGRNGRSRGDFTERYRHALSAFLSEDAGKGTWVEGPLIDALELGRAALTNGPSLLDLLSMHYGFIFAGKGKAKSLSVAEVKHRLARGDEFLAQILAPFEMTRRGWNDIIGRLRHTNEILEQRVAERTAALRETEHRFVQAQKMEAVGSLTGGLAHDFNNLLGIIIANLDLLQPLTEETPEANDYVSEALGAALRGADLTQRLLAFARKQPLKPEHVALNPLIDDLAKLLQRTLGEQFEIRLKLAPGLWPVTVDPFQLEAAITNLSTNARDAMPRGGRITITTANRHLDADYATQHAEVEPGDYAMIELSDSGIGMAPEVLNHIFEPFFTTKARGKGTGLGLSMVFGFIKQSGGHINVYSEVDKGTTFRLYLPRSLLQLEARHRPATLQPVEGGSETILVVDDNAKMRHVVMKQLTQLGYRVLEADNAPTAMLILQGPETIHLLFSDIIMPGGLDGFDLAREATRRRPTIKVLLTSGFPEGFSDATQTIPGCRLLTKPYRRADLARALRELFGPNGTAA